MSVAQCGGASCQRVQSVDPPHSLVTRDAERLARPVDRATRSHQSDSASRAQLVCTVSVAMAGR